MSEKRGNGDPGPAEVPVVSSQPEERPGTLSLLAMVLFPFVLMVAIAVFYYWIAR